MLSIWFMYDNHTFAKIKSRDSGLVVEAARLFAEDGCGSLFVRDEFDATLHGLTLQGHRLANGRFGVTRAELDAWADAVMAEISFRKAMIA